jgi:hypothetical protein
MFLAIAVVLFLLWLLGYLVINLGVFIHVLLVLAIIALIYHIFRTAGHSRRVN